MCSTKKNKFTLFIFCLLKNKMYTCVNQKTSNMKKLSLLFLVSVFAQLSILNGQTLRAYYSQTHKAMLDSEEKSTEEMILFIHPQETRYESYDRIKQRVSKGKEMDEQYKQSTEEMPNVRMTSGPPRIPYEIVINSLNSKATIVYNLRRFYSYVDEIEKIDWNFDDLETKEYLGFQLKKATADFRGRKWTAWYSEDIPVNAGPWLLSGLPGLIIHAYDDLQEVEFLMSALEDENLEDKWVVEDGDGHLKIRIVAEVSKSQFFKIRNNMVKNPDAYRLSTRGVSLTDFGLLNPKSWSIVPTNPIDLHEKNY